MKILTYADTIEITHYEKLEFSYERAMVSFTNEGYRSRLYFNTITNAREFVQEIIEGLYSGRDQIDLSHYMCVTECYSISRLLSEISSRINNFKPEEDE